MRVCNMSIATQQSLSRNERPRHIGCTQAALASEPSDSQASLAPITAPRAE